MAIKVGYVTGPWSTATNWGTGAETATCTTTALAISTTKQYTAVFTAPNTTNNALGVIMAINNWGTEASIYTVTLQEYNGSSWVDKNSATLNKTDLDAYRFNSISIIMQTMYFFKIAPYTYTTTTAGYYRYSIVASAGTSSTFYQSAATVPWGLVVDDRNGVPAANDDVYIAGDKTGEITITLDSSLSVGSHTGSETVTILFCPSVVKALTHCFNGTLTFGESASTTLTIDGAHLVSNGGGLHIGTSASPYPVAYTAKIVYKAVTTYGFGAMFINFNPAEKVSICGRSKTYKTLWVSGTGVTGSALVVADDTGWQVGDRIAISGNAYSKKETKFLRANPSSKNWTLADTLGGAESALANTHYATDWVLNMERNVVFESDTPASKFFYVFTQQTYATGIVYYYMMFNNIGSNSVSVRCMLWGGAVGYSANLEGTSWYCLNTSSGATAYGCYFYSVSKPDTILKNTVFFLINNGYCYPFVLICYAGTFTNLYCVGGTWPALILGGYKVTYDNMHVMSAGLISPGYSSATISFAYANYGCQLTNSTVDSSPACALNLGTGTVDFKAKNCNFGSVYANGAGGDIAFGAAGSFVTGVFDTCTFTSSSLFFSASITAALNGSKIGIATKNGVANTDITYYPHGTITRCGPSLTDTTVRTAGGFAPRFECASSLINTELIFDLATGNLQNQVTVVGVWVYINNAAYYGGSAYQMPRITVNYDNGTTTYGEAAQIAGSWQYIHTVFTPTTTYGSVTVTLSARTDATSTNAYVYWDDFSGGFLVNTTMDSWSDALPVPPAYSFNVNAATFWEYGTTAATAAGSMGKHIKKKLSSIFNFTA